jgi:hypothetical protein
MYGKGFIKLVLGGIHLKGNCDSLENFIDVTSNGMDTYDIFLAISEVTDQFKERT